MSEHIIVDRTTTWHAIGKSVAECESMEQVLSASGLDYEVVKEPIFMEDPQDGECRITIPNRFATVRSTDGHVYDIVSRQYEIVQNRQAFEFVDYMGAALQFEKAGETESGMVYIIGKLPPVNVLGDEFTPHVIFRNGFDGKTKVMAAICPLRMVCQNQFNIAFKTAQNTIAIRHVGNASTKLQEAREVLRLSADCMETLTMMAEHFVSVKLAGHQMEQILDYLFPFPDNGKDMNSFKRNRLEKARSGLMAAYNADDNANFVGTAWGAVNAYADYMTHKEPMGSSGNKVEGKFINTTFKVSMEPMVKAIEAVC